MRLTINFSLIGCLFLGMGQCANAGLITFSDTEFQDSDWTAILGKNTATSVSFGAQQQVLGGNPSSFRQVTHSWTGPGFMWVLHLMDGAVITPSSDGQIDSIQFSYDLNWLNPPQNPNAVAFSPLLRQNGTFYEGPVDLIQVNSWVSFTTANLIASDFTRHQVEGTGGVNPDFSLTGAPVEIGFASENGTGTGLSITTISGIDNFSAVAETTVGPSGAVPEPSTLTLFILALLSFSIYVFRHPNGNPCNGQQ